MDSVAQVFEKHISSVELNREIEKLQNQQLIIDPKALSKQALASVIDRYLLLHKAVESGIIVTDEEYEIALLEIIDLVELHDSLENALVMKGIEPTHFESIIRNKIIIKKYIHSRCNVKNRVEDSKLLAFYEDNIDFFCTEEEVRASHILVRGPDAESKSYTIRDSIHSAEDFIKASNEFSHCPSNAKCGDLGYFSRGKLLTEIEKVAFSLKLNEISEPFQTHYGFHILMVTDKHEMEPIPFEKLKDSLRARLEHIEREYCLTQHIRDLRTQYAAHITIFPNALQ